MPKLVAISLMQTCIIGGLPRSPVEGVQYVSEEEAERLIEQNMAQLATVDTDEDAPPPKNARRAAATAAG